jgi:hypothetical protein
MISLNVVVSPSLNVVVANLLILGGPGGVEGDGLGLEEQKELIAMAHAFPRTRSFLQRPS